MDFDEILWQLKKGAKAWREGWNGKGMFIFLIKADEWKFTNGKCDNFELLPFIAMKTADNKIVPWLASQTDQLADDWDYKFMEAA